MDTQTTTSSADVARTLGEQQAPPPWKKLLKWAAIAALVQAAEAAQLANELALVQYNSGLVDFQTVLNADRQLVSTQDALAVSNGELTSNLIRLYKAFGGGWSAFPASSTAAAGTP